MCNHKIYVVDHGLRWCYQCGLLLGPELLTSELAYGTILNPPRRIYQRSDRLTRLLKGLRGRSCVPSWVVENVKDGCEVQTALCIRKFLKRNKLSKFTCKIPSILFQLGHVVFYLSNRDVKQLNKIFRELTTPIRFSFTYIIPYLLYIFDAEIFRKLKHVLKKPSRSLHRKYDTCLISSVIRLRKYEWIIPVIGHNKFFRSTQIVHL